MSAFDCAESFQDSCTAGTSTADNLSQFRLAPGHCGKSCDASVYENRGILPPSDQLLRTLVAGDSAQLGPEVQRQVDDAVDIMKRTDGKINSNKDEYKRVFKLFQDSLDNGTIDSVVSRINEQLQGTGIQVGVGERQGDDRHEYAIVRKGGKAIAMQLNKKDNA